MPKRDEHALKQIISGKDRSAKAALLRTITRCLEPFYTLGMATRNQLYNRNLKNTHKVNTPVISIGNLTTGGTGKTPIVIDLAKWLCLNKLKVGIILRGYNAKQTGGQSDEAQLLQAALPDDIQIQVNPNRVQAANKLAPTTDVILLDDGFQHRRLGRSLDIVLIDATCPFGFGHVLPRGLMRESKHALARADAIIITRSNMIQSDQLTQLKNEIQTHHGQPPLAICNHVWEEWINQNNQNKQFNDHKVYAFCGIGNPDPFFEQINKEYDLIDSKAFPDHHAYSDTDVTQIIQTAQRLGVNKLLTTEKDWVKLEKLIRKNSEANNNFSWCRPNLSVQWVSGEDKLKTMILDIIKDHQSSETP